MSEKTSTVGPNFVKFLNCVPWEQLLLIPYLVEAGLQTVFSEGGNTGTVKVSPGSHPFIGESLDTESTAG